jgi:hypothetical protein
VAEACTCFTPDADEAAGHGVEISSNLGTSTVFYPLALRGVNPHGPIIAINAHTGDRH